MIGRYIVFTSLVVLALVPTTTMAFADDAPVPAPAPAPTPQPQRITVEISALRSAKGVVRCALFTSANGFPADPSRALARAIAPSIANGHAQCMFDNIKPGTYAVGFLHDENNNGKMDTNFLGIPTEGYGASNNARGTMGPPKFDDAKFNHAGPTTTLQLKTAY
jgi:uncharacterized protein (DUF2141 family)